MATVTIDPELALKMVREPNAVPFLMHDPIPHKEDNVSIFWMLNHVYKIATYIASEDPDDKVVGLLMCAVRWFHARAFRKTRFLYQIIKRDSLFLLHTSSQDSDLTDYARSVWHFGLIMKELYTLPVIDQIRLESAKMIAYAAALKRYHSDKISGQKASLKDYIYRLEYIHPYHVTPRSSIEELDIPTRTLKALVAKNIEYIDQLTDLTEEEISQLNGIGTKSLVVLKRALSRYGFTFKPVKLCV